jgi:nitrite reductase/ring-hydroxylating ferredoxin subunit
MAWHEAVVLNELVEKGKLVVELDSHSVLLIWHDNQVHAVASKCPHLGLPLTKAKVNDHNEIVCPFHKSAFDLCDGRVKCWSPWPKVVGNFLGMLSKPKDLKIYEVKMEDDKIWVKV